jgi:hypothetical protein
MSSHSDAFARLGQNGDANGQRCEGNQLFGSIVSTHKLKIEWWTAISSTPPSQVKLISV